jgi:phage-related baseplate assembly protein
MPNVQFAPTDARTIETAIITGFEYASRRAGQTDFTLFEGDPRRLFLQAIALIILQQNALIDITGKSNLLRYADDSTIEDIGWLYGTRGNRLKPSHATTTIEFTLSAIRNTVTTVPAGTRIIAADLTFATAVNLDIPIGELTGQVQAIRDLPGSIGNSLLPGQVFQIIDPIAFVINAENVTESSGGADLEGLESYRERVRNVPESFSTAGPDGAYWFWAKTANPGIVDVDVWMPSLDINKFADFLAPFGITNASAFYTSLFNYFRESGTGPGNVNIVALMEDGSLASADIRQAVYDICNDKKRRPLTDFLHVIDGEYIDYSIDITYWIDANRATDAIAIQNAVNAAVKNYITWQSGELGRAIIPDILTKMCIEAGARRLEIRKPHYINLRQGQVARLLNIPGDVVYGGLERSFGRA